MNLKPSQMLMLGGGLVVLIFSFFSFYEIDSGLSGSEREQAEEFCDDLRDKEDLESWEEDALDQCGDIGGEGISAWDTDYTAPLTAFPALLGLIVAGTIAATTFASVKLPDHVLSLNQDQVRLALAFTGALMMIGFLISGTEDPVSFGIGFWLMLLGSAAALAGAVMELKGDGPVTSSGPAAQAPPSPF